MPRPSNHLQLLSALNDIVNDMNTAQALIDHSRQVAATDGFVQLHLDRQQTKLDERRAVIERMYIDIPMRN